MNASIYTHKCVTIRIDRHLEAHIATPRTRTRTRTRTPRQVAETSRSEIMRLLKLNGELSVAHLCKLRKVTHTAVRRHLSSLLKEGIVTYRIEETDIGRPVHMFRLTAKSQSSFPDDYEGVALNLLDTICADSGHRGVLDFLNTANDRLIRDLRARLHTRPLEERVEGLCKYFRDAGYMSEWNRLPDGNFFLVHKNCAIYNLAAKYRQFCLLELHLIQNVLNTKISRQQYIFKDQSVCGYLIHGEEKS
jgi:predicted ArsR family transcriptional regulator